MRTNPLRPSQNPIKSIVREIILRIAVFGLLFRLSDNNAFSQQWLPERSEEDVGLSVLESLGFTLNALSATEVAQAAYGAGFRGGALVNAVAVAGAESGFVLGAVNNNPNGTVDRGLWQINSIHSEYNAQLLLTSAA